MPAGKRKASSTQSRLEDDVDSKQQLKAKKSRGLEKENTVGADESMDKLIEKLNSTFLVSHPKKELFEFWEHAVKLNANSPKEAFSSLQSLKLTGPFDLISDFYNKTNGNRDYSVESRFATDLPEMQTILVHDGGRFCYWRDTPKKVPNLLIHVSVEKEHFPEFTIVGGRSPFCAIQYLLMLTKTKQQFDHFFPEHYDKSGYDQKHLQTLKKTRAKEAVGKPFHGLGIKVKVNEKGIGYRPVSDDIAENNRLKKDIETMGTTDSEETKKAVKDRLYKMYSWVQFANDEMDFGMGLEFGHDLFVSNYACFDGMTKSVLKTSYELLGRNEFATILEKHWEAGRRSSCTV